MVASLPYFHQKANNTQNKKNTMSVLNVKKEHCTGINQAHGLLTTPRGQM